MFPEATRQADNVLPPVQGATIALAIDATSRPYDLQSVVLGSDGSKSPTDHVFLTLQNDGANTIYFACAASNANAIDDTAVLAAGSPLSFANGYCAPLFAGSSIDFRVQKTLHRYLIVKCASGKTSTLRFYASSQPNASSTGI